MSGLPGAFADTYLKFHAQRQKEIQDAVDQAAQEVGLQRQQAALDETTRYHKDMMDRYAKDLTERQAHDVAQEQAGIARDKTAQDRIDQANLNNQRTNYRNTFMPLAAGGMKFGPASDQASFGTGYNPTPEDIQRIQTMGPQSQTSPPMTPDVGGNVPPEVMNAYSQAAQAATPQAPQPSWRDMVLPSATERIKLQESLVAQREAHAALQKRQGERMAEMAPLDMAYKQAQTDHLANVDKWGADRDQQMKENFLYKKWWDGKQLNIKQAQLDIQRTNSQLRAAELSNRQNTQALTDARQSRTIMSTELGRTETSLRQYQSAYDKGRKAFELAQDTVTAYEQHGVPNLQGDDRKNYDVAVKMRDMYKSQLPQQQKAMQELKNNANQYRGLLNLIPDKVPVSGAGRAITPPSGPPMLQPWKPGARQGSLPNIPQGGSMNGPAAVTPPAGVTRRQFYDKQGNAKWFTLKKGLWAPE